MYVNQVTIVYIKIHDFPVAGDASLSAGSQQAEARAPSLAGLAGSLGGHDAASPAAHRLEVTADVADAPSDDDLPCSSASTSRLRSLFLYGAPHPPDLEAGPDAPPPPPAPAAAPAQLTAACETGAPAEDASAPVS